MKKYFESINIKTLLVTMLVSALILTTSVAYAAMTLSTDTISGSGALNLTPTGQPVIVNGNIQIPGNSLIIGNDLTTLGALPMAGSLLVGNETYADGENSGDPTIQFEHTLTNPASYTASESNFYWNTGADMTDLISINLASYFRGSNDYLSGGFPGQTVNTAMYANGGTSGNIEDLTNLYLGSGLGATTVDNFSHIWITKPSLSGGTIGNMFGIYGADLTGVATNAYAYWYDSPGVFRIKSDGVMAYYNPSFTKYTPGATDYERIVQQWNSNVAEIGTEAGGTGTLRPLRLLGPSVEAVSYKTATNCADSAGAAACGSAAAGAFVIDAGSTSVVVSTTAVTANSEIKVQFDSSLGTRLSVTCNTAPATVAFPSVTARTAGTSFTLSVSGSVAVNPACFTYSIVN